MSTEPTGIIATIPEIENAKKLALVTPASALSVKQTYAPYFATFLELEKEAALIAVNAPKAAQEMRMKLRKVRTSADKERKAMGDESRRYTDAVNEVYNLLEARLTPVEDRMEAIAKAEEIAAAARAAQLKEARIAELTPFAAVTATDISFYDLAGMPEVQYQGLLTSTRIAAETKQAADAKAEADRLAAETARLKREADLAAENQRLAKVAAEEKAARDAIQKKADDDRKAAQAETDRKLAEERTKAATEAKRVADEGAKKQAVKDTADKAERNRLADEAQKARDQAKALADQETARQAKEAQAKADAEALIQKAAKAPDKTKLLAFAKAVRALQVPTLTSDTGRELNSKLASQTVKFALWLEGEAAKL